MVSKVNDQKFKFDKLYCACRASHETLRESDDLIRNAFQSRFQRLEARIDEIEDHLKRLPFLLGKAVEARLQRAWY